MIRFEQIKLSDAMLKIGEGNKDKDLYFYDGCDLSDYERYDISTRKLSKYKWFIKIKDELPE